VNERPDDSTHGLRKHLNRPRTTVDQTLQALHALNLVEVEEIEEARGASVRTVWRYRLAEQVNTDALRLMGGTGNVGLSGYRDREESAKRPEKNAASPHHPRRFPYPLPDLSPATTCLAARRPRRAMHHLPPAGLVTATTTANQATQPRCAGPDPLPLPGSPLCDHRGVAGLPLICADGGIGG
jgi:hypothetical protein